MLKNPYVDFFTTTDGVRISFTTNFAPNKDATYPRIIVFVYGLVCNNQHWKFQAEYFDKLGFPILMHDFRGHFSSTSNEGVDDCTFTNFANDLNQLIDHLGAEQIILLGHSMGVNVSLEFQRQFPHKVMGMVLISGTVHPPHDNMFFSNITDLALPLFPKIKNLNSNLFHKLWTNSHQLKFITWMVKRGGFNPSKTTSEFVETYLQKIGELPEDLFFKLLQEMETHDVGIDLPKIKCPVLIMGGDKDQIVPFHCQQSMNDMIPNSKMYIIHQGSHVPQVDFPETINERIEVFLSDFHFKSIES